MSYSRNPENAVLKKSDNIRFKRGSGRVMEDDIVYALCRGMRGKEGKLTTAMGTDDDKKYGTDLFWNPEDKDRIRIDVTLNFSNKDNMPLIRNTGLNIVRKEFPVKYGVRVGNSYKNFTPFKEPVIVIGFDMDGRTFRDWENAVLDGVEHNASKILDTAYDVYDRYVNPDPEKQKETEKQLSRNTRWTRPRNMHPNLDKIIREAQKIDRSEAEKQKQSTPEKP